MSGAAHAASIQNGAAGRMIRGRQTAVQEIEELYPEELIALEDTREGLSAFMEKREPVWQN